MTAGHCEDHFHIVHVGEYDRTHNEFIQTFRPDLKMVHPSFEGENFRYDVMLVKLNGHIDGIPPVRLNSEPALPFSQAQLTLIGWGAVEKKDGVASGDRIFPDVLQQARVPYVSNYKCENEKYQGKALYKGEIFDEMLCAGSTGVDACKGDSGSPLLIENWNQDGSDVQVGLVSWGRGCGKYPGVYTRVSEVYPWIRTHICWESDDPPSYLNCQPSERRPISNEIEEAPPSMVPSSITDPSSSDDKKAGGGTVGEESQGSVDFAFNFDQTSGTRAPCTRWRPLVCLALSSCVLASIIVAQNLS